MEDTSHLWLRCDDDEAQTAGALVERTCAESWTTAVRVPLDEIAVGGHYLVELRCHPYRCRPVLLALDDLSTDGEGDDARAAIIARAVVLHVNNTFRRKALAKGESAILGATLRLVDYGALAHVGSVGNRRQLSSVADCGVVGEVRELSGVAASCRPAQAFRARLNGLLPLTTRTGEIMERLGQFVGRRYRIVVYALAARAVVVDLYQRGGDDDEVMQHVNGDLISEGLAVALLGEVSEWSRARMRIDAPTTDDAKGDGCSGRRNPPVSKASGTMCDDDIINEDSNERQTVSCGFAQATALRTITRPQRAVKPNGRRFVATGPESPFEVRWRGVTCTTEGM